MITHLDHDSVVIFHGDSRAIDLPDASVDAVVTDPPYELGFMGKSWDSAGVAFDPKFWSEILRVLKPGGHLLAFGGTRTYHRMTCAIEDAGFEIRDSLHWMYGVGFPKSLNLVTEWRKNKMLCECHAASERDVRSVSDADVPSSVHVTGEQGKVLLQGMSESGLPTTGRTESASDAWSEESCMEGRRDAQAPKGELLRCYVCEVSSGVPDDGSEGRIRDEAPPRHGGVVGPCSYAGGSGSPPRSRSKKQRALEPAAIPLKPGAQACGGCGKPREADLLHAGFGTALKPGHEPIVLARKPLVGTVAANVEAHGTGALNIDACRIEMSQTDRDFIKKACRPNSAGQLHKGAVMNRPETPTVNVHEAGRWPANVLLDEDAAAELDAQAGIRTSGSTKAGTYAGRKGLVYSPDDGRQLQQDIVGSEGGASRFFYVSKPSRKERDLGCHHLPAKFGGEATDREEGSAGLNSPRAGAGRKGGARNHHPTVKPIELMRYLVRLVTPPGGVVLDPFLGSGTTGIAALLEGFDFVGVEMTAEYLPIAEARIRWALAECGREVA